MTIPPSPHPNQVQPAQLPEFQLFRRVQDLGVRAKATALIVTLAVVPVLIIGGGATYFGNQIITQKTLQEKQKFGTAISLRLSEFVRSRLNDVETIASTPLISNPAILQSTPPEAVIKYFDDYVERDPTYDSISAVTLDGAYDFLRDGQGLRTTKGNYAPENDKRKIFVENNVPYFLEVRDTLRPAISPLRISNASGKSSFFVAVPAINNSTNQLTYVIYSRTNAQDISNLINQFVSNLVGDTSSVELEGLQFRVIDHGKAYFERTSEGEEKEVPSPRIVISGESVKIDGQEFQPGGNIFIKENRVFVSENNEGIGVEMQSIFPKYAELRRGRVVTTVTDVSQQDGQEYLLTYVPIPAVEDLPFDWGVLVSQPTSVVFAPQRTLTLTLLVGTVIAAAVVGAIAAIIANRATRPIVAATKAVEKIGQGDLETRLEVQGNDEIASLGSNINQMATQLQEFLDAQAREAEQERLLVAARGVGAIRVSDLQGIFDQALEGARNLLQLERLVIYRFNTNSTGGVVSESVEANLPSALSNNVADNCIPEELCQEYRKGRIVNVSNVSQARIHPDHLKLLKRLKVKSSLVVPIVGAEQLFGLLIAHTCSTTRDWRDSEVNFLRRLGNELGLSVFWATLLEQTERLAEEQRQLKENLQRRAIELLQEVEPVSQGDLTIRAKVTADEIGTIADAYNASVASLQKIVLRVQQATVQVAETTHLNETSVRSLSEEALHQSQEVAAALTVIKEMADVMHQLATTAEQSEVAVQEATQTVAEGDLAMNRTVDGIQSIRETVANTAKKVGQLGESSQEISKIVNLIKAFATQTHMLALNASIEAARAGEEGQGFVAIANEVRALAQQSARASEEIKKLAESIQEQTTEVVADMEVGTKQVEAGTRLVEETRQSLNKITATNATVSHLVMGVSHATVAQSQASETIAQTMNEVAELADKTSSEASQVSSSFEQLWKVAQVLQAEVDRFKVS